MKNLNVTNITAITGLTIVINAIIVFGMVA